jgi:hypothetical protein
MMMMRMWMRMKKKRRKISFLFEAKWKLWRFP